MHSSTIDVQKIKKELENNQCVESCAKKYGTTGDKSRMKICYLLRNHPSLTVSEIADLVGLSVSAASHSLKKLKQAEVVTSEKTAQEVRYTLEDNEFTRMLVKQLAA